MTELAGPKLRSLVADTGIGDKSSGPRVEVFGIRHHGPGSARSLVAALEMYGPDVVLIEGPADADPLLKWVLAEGMEPPLALLAYAPEQPGISAFWPFAVFSPEWQAMTWARRRGIEVAFCDLPAGIVLARQVVDRAEPDVIDAREADATPRPRRRRRTERHDPLGVLASAAGYDDAERWWDDVVESRRDGSSPFPALTEAMAELRAAFGAEEEDGEARSEARREAYMRQTIRAAIRRGRQRVAVVCGAWHAPVLQQPMPPASRDIQALRGARRRKIAITWVPWTHERLASESGYGAGIGSPGWYHHLWTAPDQPITRWLTKVAHSLRARDVPVSSAHVIEAVRLAETLAVLRGRPLAGLTEVTEATRAVLCDGDEIAVTYITRHLVVGQAIGAVNERVPTTPFEADLVARCRALRVRREVNRRVYDLDLRKPNDRARSKLFHQLRLLDVDWIQPARSEVQALGTFRETWQALWRPELSVAVVAASVWGTTVASAATSRVRKIAAEGSLAELTRTVELCLLADLPEALDELLRALADKAALDVDVVHLMDALPALARAQRYGNVRQTDTHSLRQVGMVIVRRICVGLPRAVGGLDEDSATAMRRLIDGVHGAVALLRDGQGGEVLTESWMVALAGIVDRTDVNGQLVGRLVRLLLDAGRLSDVPVRLTRALSHGVEASAKAAWVDGFFADGAQLLIHDPVLRELLDGWIRELDEREFVDLLPLVRRTFGTFGPAERRAIADRIAAAGLEQHPAEESEQELVDSDLAAPALATVALILGRAARHGGDD
jgi:hypothetical protein